MAITHETQFEDHFPITVMVSHHAGLEQINQEIVTIIRQMRDQFITNEQENEALTGTVSTYGGYQTSKKIMFLGLPETSIRRLRDEVILPGIETYLTKVYGDKININSTRLMAWANILAAGDWQAPHMHPTTGNLVSGVYYVDMPDKPIPEGCLEFLNPHPVSRHHGISLTRRLHPKTGDLIIFPPYYIHYVYPFKGGSERAIIAFDVVVQKTEFVF
jgi:Putative 2OG-Fe(II) oxygenase